MIEGHIVAEYLRQTYKKIILDQIPPTYSSEATILTITLKVDLTKLLRQNSAIAKLIIGRLCTFYECAKHSIIQFMNESGFQQPQNGLHLNFKVSNCPMPVLNIRSPEFILASFEQTEGIMCYLRSVLITEVGQQQMFLFSGTQIWSTRCQCSQKNLYHKSFTHSLVSLIQSSTDDQQLKSRTPTQTNICPQCSKSYSFRGLENQTYLSCQKINFQLSKTYDKQSTFESTEFEAYAEVNTVTGLKSCDIISCCIYFFARPVVQKILQGQVMTVKPQARSYLVSINKCGLEIQARNCELYYTLGKIGVNQAVCRGLEDCQTLLQNYQNLIHSLNKFHFSYIPASILTTLKLATLNSLCTHFQLTPGLTSKLHLCLVTDDLPLLLQLAVHSISLPTLANNVKRFPSDYDNQSISNWIKCSRGSIIVVVAPNKKDCKFIEDWITNTSLGLTFWVLCQTNPKKELNLELFGVVLDVTSQKNMQVCRESIQQAIDLKLSAFIPEEFDFYPQTAIKNKRKDQNPLHLHFQNLLQSYIPEQPNSDNPIEQQISAKKLLQKYYLKCRDVKKTSSLTLSNLFNLAKGFSYIRYGLQFDVSRTTKLSPHLSILDSVLAIFLDEESSRNKYSSTNTLFGIQVSKLILNQQQCEISFWDYLEREDGMLTEQKNYLSKSDMFRRIVGKLNSLLAEDDSDDENENAFLFSQEISTL